MGAGLFDVGGVFVIADDHVPEAVEVLDGACAVDDLQVRPRDLHRRQVVQALRLIADLRQLQLQRRDPAFERRHLVVESRRVALQAVDPAMEVGDLALGRERDEVAAVGAFPIGGRLHGRAW
jgi:hypothetical protein